VSAELCLMRLARPELLTGDMSALTARIAELEKRLAGGVAYEAAPARADKPMRPRKAPVSIEKDDLPPFDADGAADDAPPFDRDDAPPFDAHDAPPFIADDAPPFDIDDTPADAPQIQVDAPPFEPDDAPTPFDAESAPPAKDAKNAPEQAGDETWQAILREAVAAIDILPFVTISNREYVAASFEGNTLCLCTKYPLAEQLLNQQEIRQALSRAAEKVLGHPVPLRITSGQPKQAPAGDKLDRLSRFPNVTFE
jgi:hypothetical protein